MKKFLTLLLSGLLCINSSFVQVFAEEAEIPAEEEIVESKNDDTIHGEVTEDDSEVTEEIGDESDSLPDEALSEENSEAEENSESEEISEFFEDEAESAVLEEATDSFDEGSEALDVSYRISAQSGNSCKDLTL